MNTPELIHDLTDAAQEIRQLRRRNEILEAKVEVFDSMMLLLTTAPNLRPMTASPDVVYKLEQHRARLEAAKSENA